MFNSGLGRRLSQTEGWQGSVYKATRIMIDDTPWSHAPFVTLPVAPFNQQGVFIFSLFFPKYMKWCRLQRCCMHWKAQYFVLNMLTFECICTAHLGPALSSLSKSDWILTEQYWYSSSFCMQLQTVCLRTYIAAAPRMHVEIPEFAVKVQGVSFFP